MDNKKYYLVQDQSAKEFEPMFFVTNNKDIEKQYSGYVVWKTGRKKELEELAERWNLEAKLNMEEKEYTKIIKLFNERKEKQDDGQMWAIIYKDDIEYDDDLEWELFVEWFFPEDCRGFYNDWFVEVNQNILEYFK